MASAWNKSIKQFASKYVHKLTVKKNWIIVEKILVVFFFFFLFSSLKSKQRVMY